MQSRVILLTGQYGTSHHKVAETLCGLAKKRLKGLTKIQPLMEFYSLEDKVWEVTGTPEAFYELPNDSERDELWKDAFSTIKAKIENDNPVFAIVSLHVVYFWKERFFSCVDWDRLVTLEPRVILTLVDDIYDIHERILSDQQRRGAQVPGGRYSLLEILSWRMREVHTCNLLAKHLFVNPELFPSIDRFLQNKTKTNQDISRHELEQIFHKPCDHYVISVKQDKEDFYRLLFQRKKMRVYLSYPISEPRKQEDVDYFKRLLSWRKRVHAEFVAFDPVAIDEARFNENEEGIKDGNLRGRIPYDIGTPIVAPPQETPDSWPVEELRPIRDLIIQQIGERDYKLEDQALMVAMWRPLYMKQTHDGVDSEGVFAAARGIPTHSYHPSEDRTANKPFPPHYGVSHLTEEEIFVLMKRQQKEWAKKQKENTY